jgi:hypothetical protein
MALLPNAQASRAADAVTARCNSGVLRVYSGSVPATADDSIGAATLLATFNFSATAFGAASNGVATANALTQSGTNAASGTPTFARAFETGGTVVVFQCTAGTSGAELNITPAIESGGTAAISSLTYTQSKG